MSSDPGRYAYLPLIDRPKISWPGGARVAFWVAPNIEYYELAPPGPFWPRPVPDILSYSHRDYGNRSDVGEFGIRYALDMVHDDQPMPLAVRHGRLISVPYSFELNDICVMGGRGYGPDRYAALVFGSFRAQAAR
jgi:hypothetical protein